MFIKYIPGIHKITKTKAASPPEQGTARDKSLKINLFSPHKPHRKPRSTRKTLNSNVEST